VWSHTAAGEGVGFDFFNRLNKTFLCPIVISGTYNRRSKIMARKSLSSEITQETKADEPSARAAKRTATTKAPRVNAARHTKALVESVVDPKENAHDLIARMAYSYWEARGGEDGNAIADWLRAEHEYRERVRPAQI
jgi:hypothetical protein